MCGPYIPSVRLVVGRADLGARDEGALRELQDNADRRGIELPVSPISSFSTSQDAEVQAGTGIAELVAHTVEVGRTDVEFWPDGVGNSPVARNALRIGRGSLA